MWSVALLLGVAAVTSVVWRLRLAVLHYRSLSASPLDTWLVTRLCWWPLRRRRRSAAEVRSILSRAPRRDGSGVDHVGLLLGAALGDALGAGVEMVGAEAMARLQPQLWERYVNLRVASFSVNYVEGMYTDDTEHTLANVHALCSGQPITSELLLSYYRAEYERSRNWVGVGRQGHGAIIEYLESPSEAALAHIRARQNAKEFPGNAPPMRAAVLGLLPLSAMEAAAIVNADVTHPHSYARAASFAVALALHYMAVLRGEPDGLLRFVIGRLRASPAVDNVVVVRYLESIDGLPADLNREALVGNAWGLHSDALHTAGAALFLLKHADGPWTLLQRCLLLGGDVDSVASVCLSIWGAMGGIDWLNWTNFPRWPVESLEGLDYIVKVAVKLRDWHGKDFCQ